MTRPWIRRIAASLLVAVAVFLQVGWLLTVFNAPDPEVAAQRDWVAFYRTGERIVGGEAAGIYVLDFADDRRPEFSDGLPFLYPPFVAWVTIPLGVLSPLAAFLACASAAALAGIASAFFLGLGFRADRETRLFNILGTVGSAPWNAAVILGHLGATLVLAPVVAILAWTRARPMGAGAVLGVLAAKPNWGMPLLLLLLVGRQWRAAMGFLGTVLLLVIASLPLGPGLWVDWLQTVTRFQALSPDLIPPWRQATLLASLRDLSGHPATSLGLRSGWALVSVPLVLGVGAAWHRFGRTTALLPRLVGVALLAVLVTNPYAYFYDALFLLPAASVLWSQPDLYTSRRIVRWARGWTLLVFGWMYVQYFLLMERAPSLVGLMLAVWLILELIDLGRRPAAD